MGFVEDDEVVGEEEAFAFGAHFVLGGEEGKEEGVVEDEDFGFGGGAAGVLVVAAGVGAAAAGGADVGFAADLGPDIRGGGEIEIAEGAVFGFLFPFPEGAEFVVFGGAEEVAGAAHGAGEAGGAEVVAAAFEEDGGEGLGEEFLDDGDVFGDELFLEIDGVGGDDGFALMALGGEDGGEEVGEGFADAGAGFDDDGAFFFEGLADFDGHALLFGAVFEVGGLGEDALFGEGVVHLEGEAGEGVWGGRQVADPAGGRVC